MIIGKHFSKYYLKYAWAFLIGIGILVTIDWFQLQIPINIGTIIDILTFRPNEMYAGMVTGVSASSAAIPYFDNYVLANEEVMSLLKEVIIIAAVVAFGRFAWRFAIFGTSRQIEYELRKVMFLHAVRLPQSYYSRKKVGGLMTHFINDLNAVREAFGPGILSLIDGVFLGGFALYRMFVLNVSITLIVLAPIVVLIVLVAVVNKSMRAKFRIRQDSFEKMSDFTQESFSGIQVIKAYVREYKELMTFKEKNEDFYERNINYVRQMTRMQIVVSTLSNIIILLIVVIGGYFIINPFGNTYSAFTSGNLVAYIGFYGQLLWPISAVTRFFYITGQAKASSKRIAEFLDSPIIVEDRINAVDANLNGTIKVSKLTFTYPGDENPVLKNVSFEIKAGESVGILGKTGSGKTTLVDLLMRTYNVEDNSIFIDGHDIMDLKIACVRDTIGYVPQDNFLFSDTIANNIGFSDKVTDMEKVKKVAELSDISGNIEEFPEKYETVLGERGVTVSGGQKQRISIARALNKDPKVLILDDSVSAVDTKTEDIIIHNLNKERKGKTTIFIAHRISTVKNMDKIILLDDGKIVAIGKHDDLLNTCSLYADMVRRQQLENIVKGVE